MPPLNLIGRIFGKLTVLSQGTTIGGKTRWNCSCECGNTCSVTGTILVKLKGTKSCGCLKKTHFVDLTGQKYNKVTLNKLVGQNHGRCWVYEVTCDCGKKFRAEGNDIKSERIKSCGCSRFDNAIARLKEDPYSSMFNSIYASYRNKAQPRGYTFTLTQEEFMTLAQKNCHYCDTEPMNTQRVRRSSTDQNIIRYNGLDRIDNNVGYELNNVVPCCKICNQAKHQMTETYFYEWISKVFQNLKKIGKLNE